MSRVIKFRAWNAARNAMHYNCDISGGCAYAWKNPPDDTVEATVSTPDGRINLYSDWAIQVKRPDLVLMQFTGLTDCNGVEVYESDVVADHIGVGIVKYSDQHAGFRVAYGDGRAKWFYDYLESERKTIEVIGNTYEHPHLLNHSSEQT